MFIKDVRPIKKVLSIALLNKGNIDIVLKFTLNVTIVSQATSAALKKEPPPPAPDDPLQAYHIKEETLDILDVHQENESGLCLDDEVSDSLIQSKVPSL